MPGPLIQRYTSISIYSRVCGQFCFCLPMLIAKLQRLAHDQPCTCTRWNRSRESKALLVLRYVEPVEGILLGDLPRYMVELRSLVPVYWEGGSFLRIPRFYTLKTVINQRSSTGSISNVWWSFSSTPLYEWGKILTTGLQSSAAKKPSGSHEFEGL